MFRRHVLLELFTFHLLGAIEQPPSRIPSRFLSNQHFLFRAVKMMKAKNHHLTTTQSPL